MSRTAEIINVGTELLLGDIVNTNGAFLAKELAAAGIEVFHQTVVGDNPGRLRQAVELALSRSDILITTGGLGPTFDDLTKETVCGCMGKELALHQPSYEHIRHFYEEILRRPMPENVKKQAMLPLDGVVLPNHNGTAPGVIVPWRKKAAVLLPGPPQEMEAMFRESVLPWLRGEGGEVILSHNLHFYGIGEAQLEEENREWFLSLGNPSVAPYCKKGECLLRVTASADTHEQAQALIKPVIARLKERYGSLLYGVDCGSLQGEAVRRLREKGLHVATAESCTGGYIAKRITEIEGSSAVFEYGIVSYSNQVKEHLLGVSPETLKKYTAVSEQTAREMAAGVRRLSGAEIGVSVTGLAGNTPDPDGKPNGLVYVGVDCDGYQEVAQLHLARGYGNDERENIRYLAASHALHLVLKACDIMGKEGSCDFSF